MFHDLSLLHVRKVFLFLFLRFSNYISIQHCYLILQGLICAKHRIAMCNLASRSSDFVMVDSWEVSFSLSLYIYIVMLLIFLHNILSFRRYYHSVSYARSNYSDFYPGID